MAGYFQCRGITPVLRSRRALTASEPPSAEHPDRSHDHHAEQEYGLPPPSPSVQASDAHHPGETFTVCRLRNICDRIIHRLLQYFRIIVTTVARNRDMAYRLLHHLFKHRTHIIRVRLLPSAGAEYLRPHHSPPSAVLPDRSHDHHAEQGYGSQPPSPSVQASDAHHPG